MTDITELAQREKFEAWAEERCALPWGYLKNRRTNTGYFSKHDYTSLWAAWKAAGAELVEALEKAQQEAEELSKFKEVMASAADALKAGKPLNLESLFKGELASAMFAMMFAGEFVRSGATNYLELLYDAPEFGEMTVTLQKVEGKTPGQRIAELESRTVKLPESIVDKVCLTAAEIHAQGSGVTDDKAQDIIDRIREILTPVAGIKVEAE